MLLPKESKKSIWEFDEKKTLQLFSLQLLLTAVF